MCVWVFVCVCAKQPLDMRSRVHHVSRASNREMDSCEKGTSSPGAWRKTPSTAASKAGQCACSTSSADTGSASPKADGAGRV